MSVQRSAVTPTPAVAMLTLLCWVRSASHAAPPLAAFAAARMSIASGRGVATFCAVTGDEQNASVTLSEGARKRIMESSKMGRRELPYHANAQVAHGHALSRADLGGFAQLLLAVDADDARRDERLAGAAAVACSRQLEEL